MKCWIVLAYVQLVSMCLYSLYIWYLIQEICIVSQLLRLQYTLLKTEFYYCFLAPIQFAPFSL